MMHGFPKCLCQSMYTGKYCETFICSQYCENDAKCLPVHEEGKPARAACICSEGFSGPRCEVNLQECKNYCQNNATCIINEQSKKLECLCPQNFEGERCDECTGLHCPSGM